MKSKVFIVGKHPGQVGHMFTSRGFELTDDLAAADLVQFTGGSDVNPLLYNRLKHSRTHVDETRDKFEVVMFHNARVFNKKMAGICRGGQFLCVMAGHELWQDVDNHNRGSHQVKDKETDVVVNVTSTHHQMMRLKKDGPEAVVIATADHLSSYKEEVDIEGYETVHRKVNDMGEDLEVVFFPGDKSLSFQPHPEYAYNEACTNYYFYLLEKYLGVK